MTAPYPDFDGRQNCSGTHDGLWFPTYEEGDSRAAVDAHRKLIRGVCDGCVWRGPCLEFALGHDVYGWWAGTSPDDRRRLRQERRIVPVPVQSGVNLHRERA